MDLKELRKKKNFTQTEIAEKIGIKQHSYSLIENGKRKLTVEHAKQLAGIYGIEWWELFDGKDK